MNRRALSRAVVAVCASAFVLLAAAPALAGDANAGDVWVDNVGQPAGPGHEMDPHLACADINLWGSGLADSHGSYTIDGWPPSGSQERDYGPSAWSYSGSGTKRLDVISVWTLIDNAIANGDVPQSNQGFHFKLQFSQDPQKHKTFWVNCGAPSIATTATSSMLGQPIRDVATLSGGDAPTGTITWKVYAAGTGCRTSLDTVSDHVSGDGVYLSPGFTPSGTGVYEWVASYSGDANNAAAGSSCTDPKERSTVQTTPAPAIALVKFESDGASGSLTHGPLPARPGDTIDYRMTVVNTGNTPLVITFSDPHCDGGTLSAPTVLEGTFDPGTSTLSSGGALRYSCSHVLLAADAPQFTNTASVSGLPPTGPPVTASDSVVALVDQPAMTVVKLQRDGSSGSFTTAEIAANAGDTIQYEIRVTNTGNTPLALSLSDPRCGGGTVRGPSAVSGGLSGDVLSPGGVAQYTCSHVLSASDPSPFTNTATVTGQPPVGPPVIGTSSVSATKQSLHGVAVVKCGAGKVKMTTRVHGRTIVVCAPKKKKHVKRHHHHHSREGGRDPADRSPVHRVSATLGGGSSGLRTGRGGRLVVEWRRSATEGTVT